MREAMKINSIYKKSIFNHRKAMIFWGIGLILIGLFYASIYPSIGDNKQFQQAFEHAPEGFKALIVSGDFFATPNGFIHAEFFTITMPLITGILAITISTSLLAKEEEAGTMELLLARPVSRVRIIAEKFLAMLSIMAIMSAFIWLGLFLGSLLVDKFDITLPYMAIAVANLGLLAVAFGSLALLITSIKNSRGLASGIAGVFFIFSYVVGTFGEQVGWLKKFEAVSLFHYFDSAEILRGNTHYSDMWILGAVIAVAGLLSVIAFSHRDTGK